MALIRPSEWWECVRMAMDAVWSHKLRSGLTLLGVTVGVFSIILVMTTVRAMQQTVEGELAMLGAHTFVIQKWPEIFFTMPENWEKYARRKTITWQQFQSLEAKATRALSVGAEQSFWGGEAISKHGKTPPTVDLIGATPGVFPARNWVVKQGRALTETDVDGASDICLLGATLEKTLFPFGSALGESVKFNGIPYRVVGVLAPLGAMIGGDQDNFAVIPLSAGLNRYGRSWRSLKLLVQASDGEVFEDTLEQVRGILRTLRKVPPGEEDDFEVFTNDSLIGQFRSITLTARVGAAAISSVALLAAGIGIMNIMLVSVTERTREIGIRRSIGARRSNILFQFLVEAVVLCQLGGVLGILLGLAGGNLAAKVLNMPLVVPLDWVVYGLLLCSMVGVVFGVYPARKAARLDPVESLRYE